MEQQDIYATRSLSPMLLCVSKPFDDAAFLFEPKYDGARALFYIADDSVHLVSRNGNDFTHQFPEFWDARKHTTAACVLDGEIFGKSFSDYLKRGNLQHAVKIQLAASLAPLQFAAFDILYLGKDCLMNLPLTKRKDILARTLTTNDTVLTVPFVEEFGKEFFIRAKQANLEGIVAKRKTSVYQSGCRSHSWLKMK